MHKESVNPTSHYFHNMKPSHILFCLLILVPAAGVSQVTYHADVAPIIHNACMECHRTGEIGPMPFTTFEEVSAYGPFIEYVTSIGYMPPWSPDEDYSHFVGERVLTAEEVETISAWVDADMPEGDPADNPGAPVFPEGSQIGQPDLVFSMAEPYTHGGDMTDQYKVFVMPTGFEEDVMVRAIEVRPSNGAIAHHAVMGIDTDGIAETLDAQDPEPGYESFGDFGFNAYSSFFGAWVPGAQTLVYPEGIGRVIPAGSDLLMQMHYGPNAVEETDQTEVNLFFTDGPIEREVATEIMGPWALGEPFFIPANQTKTFHGTLTIPGDFSLISIAPHSHLIGTSWEVFATSPNNQDTLPLISIPAWDFNWQGFFTFPFLTKVPAGYTVHGIATYDNTSNNPFNPNDPPQLIEYGDNTGDEMFFVFFDYVPYEEGDEDISLETPLLSSVEPMERGAPGIQLQPNPASNRLQMLVDPVFVGQDWALLDLNGRSVQAGQFRSGNDRIVVRDLPNGVYLFKGPLGAQRVVIQH